LFRTRPSESTDTRRPPVPFPPKPSPVYVVEGRSGNPGNVRYGPLALASRPLIGVPLGSVNRTVSRYSNCRFGLAGVSTVALGIGVKVIANLCTLF